MENTEITYNSLLLIVVLATFIPILIKKMKKIHIPIVVGEILAGMIIGKSGFNLIVPNPWLNFLNSFGFAFLMFLSGLEIDFNMVNSNNKINKKNRFSTPGFLSSIWFISALCLSFILSFTLHMFGLIDNVTLIALILSATSLGVVVPTLKEKKIATTAFGQVILLSALIADFATMILITLYISLYTSENSYGVLLLLILFVAFFLFYKIGKKYSENKIIEELSHATSQIKVRGTFALILIFITLAQIIGTEIILGAFLAGLIVALLTKQDTTNLILKLDAIGYGFFIPIFFILIGANFDLKYVINNPKSIYLLPALLFALYIANVVPALIFKRVYSTSNSIGAGFLLSSRLSLIIATSEIGLKLNMISKEVNGSIILVAIISCTLSPLIFNKLSHIKKSSKTKLICFIGVSNYTLLLGKRLSDNNLDIIYFTTKDHNATLATKQGFQVVKLTSFSEDSLIKSPISKANKIVIDLNNKNQVITVNNLCKNKLKIKKIIILPNNNYNLLPKEVKDSIIVSSSFATILMTEHLIIHPKAYHLLFEEKSNFYIFEVSVQNPLLYNKPIRKIKLPGDCLIISILRNDEKIIPHGNNILKENDLIMLVGEKSYASQVDNMFN